MQTWVKEVRQDNSQKPTEETEREKKEDERRDVRVLRDDPQPLCEQHLDDERNQRDEEEVVANERGAAVVAQRRVEVGEE